MVASAVCSLSFSPFCVVLQPQRALALATVSRVRGVVQSMWPDAAVDVFGSLACGLWLPHCDEDLVVRVRHAVWLARTFHLVVCLVSLLLTLLLPSL